MREYHFYVYILQSASRRALYIGMTNNLLAAVEAFRQCDIDLFPKLPSFR